MKKRLTSLAVAISLISTIVLTCVGNVVGFAATITESNYPFANNRVNLKLDYESPGTDVSNITTYRITNDKFAVKEGTLAVELEHLGKSSQGKSPYFRYKTIDRAENMLGMLIYIDNSENEDIKLGFTPHLDSILELNEKAKYYLLGDKTYEEFTYDKNGTITIAKGFKGKIVVPFSNFKDIDTNDITGFRITFISVPNDETRHIYFDDFGYIGEKFTDGEISPDKFPYTLIDMWDEYDYSDASPFKAVGDTLPGNIYIKDSYVFVGLDNANDKSGFSLALDSTYSAKYDAAYFAVDARAVSDTSIAIKAVWSIKDNTCAIKKGAEYYVRLEDGRVFKYTAEEEGKINLPSDVSALRAEVAVPYESLVLSGTSTAAGKPDITGLQITFDGIDANGTNEIGFNAIGFVKTPEIGFIVPPKMTGTVVPKNELLIDMDRETKLLLTGSEELLNLYGCQSGVDQRDISYEGGKLGIPISGNPYFTWTLTGANSYQGVSFDLDIVDAKKSVNLSLNFNANKQTGVIGEGEIYYLYSEHDGLYYKYYQTEAGAKAGTILIPANFKGKVIIPFASVIDSATKEEMVLSASTSLRIELTDLNGTNKNKFIRFSNLVLHKSDDWIGDKAYKIEVGVSHIKVLKDAEFDLTQPQPQSDAYVDYVFQDWSEFYVHSFTDESSYSGTAQKIMATCDFTSRNIISGLGLGGSWTNYGYNALMVWLDTTHAPGAKMQVYMGGTGGDGKSLGFCTLNDNSKVFLYNEKLGKAKLATVNGQELILDDYKGWVIFPMTQFSTSKEPYVYERIALEREWGGGIYIGGMMEGDYIIADQSQACFFEAPSVIDTFVPHIGFTGTKTITKNTYMHFYDGTYIIVGSAATGVEIFDIVVVAAILGTTSLFVGIFAGKRRKKASK